MSKKEIGLVVGILLVAAGLAVGGYAVWRHYDAWKQSKDRVETAQNATPASDNIALTEAALDSSGLKVDASTNTSNPAQLGSGMSSSSNASSNSSASTLDPTTFSQYDKYKTADSALYADMQVGTGTEVAAGSKVAVTYKGWLTNGTQFDQSKTNESGELEPLVFTVGSHQVIPGFEQDVMGMKVGGTRLFIIPPKSGYGETAQGNIPANSVLIFQVKLAAAL